jgi:alkyl-hydroperoxide reductase/thiol specific antioxidant family protein
VKVLQRRERLEAAGATALFVAFDEPALLRRTLLAGLELPYPLLVDRDRRAYAAWGLGRASALKIWADPRVWVRYLHAVAGGERPTRFGSDTLQLGGDFVVDSAGLLAYARPQHTDDRPPVAVLLAAVEEATRG